MDHPTRGQARCEDIVIGSGTVARQPAVRQKPATQLSFWTRVVIPAAWKAQTQSNRIKYRLPFDYDVPAIHAFASGLRVFPVWDILL